LIKNLLPREDLTIGTHAIEFGLSHFEKINDFCGLIKEFRYDLVAIHSEIVPCNYSSLLKGPAFLGTAFADRTRNVLVEVGRFAPCMSWSVVLLTEHRIEQVVTGCQKPC
jgi:hypothetical protein